MRLVPQTQVPADAAHGVVSQGGVPEQVRHVQQAQVPAAEADVVAVRQGVGMGSAKTFDTSLWLRKPMGWTEVQ